MISRQHNISTELLKIAMADMAKQAVAEKLPIDLVRSGLIGAAGMDKEAFIGNLLGWGRRGAAALARKGGRLGRVGSFLQRPLQSPISIARSAPGSITARVRSPLGKAPIVTNKAIPKPSGAGPYRSAAKASKTRKDLVKETMKGPGLVKSTLRSVALPAALAGGGYLAYKAGKGLINMAERAAHNPPPYNYGLRQYQYGYGPEGQASF